jgi:hypothetical protein
MKAQVTMASIRLPLRPIRVGLVVWLAISLVAAQLLAVRDEGAAQESAEALDLAAMALLPADIGDATLRLYNAQYFTPAEVAAGRAASVEGTSEADVASKLAEVGFLRSYVAALGEPGAAGTPLFRRVVQSSIDHFADDVGAAAWFPIAVERPQTPGLEIEVVGQVASLGGESLIWRSRGGAETGAPYEAVNVAFRDGNLIAGVSIYVFDGTATDPAAVEQLGAALKARIEAVRNGESGGIGGAAVWFAGAGVSAARQYYFQRDGVPVPLYGESDETAASRSAGYPAGADVFYATQSFAAGAEGTADDVRIDIWLYGFPDAEAANAWHDAEAQAAFANAATATPYGWEGFVFRRTADRGDGVIVSGLVTQLRVDRAVAVIQVVGAPEPTQNQMDAVFAGQWMCLEAGCVEALPSNFSGAESGAPPVPSPAA